MHRMNSGILKPGEDLLVVAPNSFVDPEIGAEATQYALKKNLYSARLYGWRVRAPLKGPDDPALYQIVKEWNKANGRGTSGVLNLLTLIAMSSTPMTIAKKEQWSALIDAGTASPYGVLTDEQLNPDDRRWKKFFDSEWASEIESRKRHQEQTERSVQKQQLMWGAAAVGVVGLFFLLRRRK